MSEIPHDLQYDSKVQRLKRRYQGLSRVAAAINDLYIYGVYPSNFPNLTTVLEQAKDHCNCLLYTSPSPRDAHESRMPSSA